MTQAFAGWLLAGAIWQPSALPAVPAAAAATPGSLARLPAGSVWRPDSSRNASACPSGPIRRRHPAVQRSSVAGPPAHLHASPPPASQLVRLRLAVPCRIRASSPHSHDGLMSPLRPAPAALHRLHTVWANTPLHTGACCSGPPTQPCLVLPAHGNHSIARALLIATQPPCRKTVSPADKVGRQGRQNCIGLSSDLLGVSPKIDVP